MSSVRYRIVLFFISLLSVTGAQQNFFPILGNQGVGTSVFTFLKIGISARAVGMGEAVVALNQDASAVYYNPAAIAQLPNTQFVATRVQWPADINYDFVGITGRLPGGHYVGLSVGILHMAPMEETTEFMPHGTGNYFVFQDRFIGLTYSVRMTDRFSFGITAKHVRENLAGSIMQTWLMDVGTFYWTGFKSLRFSASLSNFGQQSKPQGKYDHQILDRETGEEVVIPSDYELFSPPTVFRVGSAMDVAFSNNQVLTIALQLNHPVDNAENLVAGVEYLLFNTVAFRGGYKLNKEEENFSLGAGFYLPAGPVRVKVDYAYTNLLHLSDPMRLSIGLEFK